MTLELKLIIAFILHLIGDYITQNSYIANNKTKNSWIALLHATMYSLPFLLICFNWYWFIIYITHYFIDRYRLAMYWIRFVNGKFVKSKHKNYRGEYNYFFELESVENFGFSKETPTFLSLWLLFIIDNIFHIVINAVSIYLGNL